MLAATSCAPATVTPSLPSANPGSLPLVPPEIATGASGSDIARLDSPDAAWWQKTPGHLQVSLSDYYVLQGKSRLP
jgi:hypothetical protein